MGGKFGLAALTLLTAVGVGAIAAAPAVAAAQTRYVSTSGDDGNVDDVNDCTNMTKPCKTIQHAVDEAAEGDTVSILDKGPYHESVRIRTSLTLVGQGSTGASRTIIDGRGDPSPSIVVDGFEDPTPPEVTIKDVAADGNGVVEGIESLEATLHVRDSSASGNQGAGIVVEKGAFDVTGSTFSHNRLIGVVAEGPARISDSLISDNGSDELAQGSILGVGVAALADSTTIVQSTITGNLSAGVYVFADFGPAIARRAESFVPTVGVSVTASTVSDNRLTGVAVGPGSVATVDDSTLTGNHGSAVFAEQSSVDVTNSTINGTTATTGTLTLPNQAGVTYLTEPPTPQARSARGPLFSTDVLRKRLSLDAAPTRRPASAPASATAGLRLAGSIVAEQVGTMPDCDGDITDQGYNLSSDAANSCKFTDAKHDQIKTDPLLGPLADNGGPTSTELLKKLSPAIDAIPAGKANCSPDATDQRGIARPQPAGGKCDVGAVELAAKPLAIHPSSLPDGTVGTAYRATITATGGQYPSYAFSLAAGSLPDGLTLGSHGRISGTPTQAGTFHFTVSVNDPVLRDYTIVVTDAAPNGGGTEPVSNTGAPAMSLAALGAGAVFVGFLMLVGARRVGRRTQRRRAHD